ncbi:hypothetical protein D3C86_2129810 [compost metagenome]
MRISRRILNTFVVSEIQSIYQSNIDVTKKLEYAENTIPRKLNAINTRIDKKKTANPP